ncbi:DUF397 domain-containing protein [Streptomyces sp. NBC_01334]|uniref:DUF397 domain-containing protein n=1 Tax=Streptomyces sp. NBC_01334 TaxID=2903827 RepID=UPI002E110DA7|nr:DUF397 domain-containing protein [Streptomyces sp. NBC_01334]
MITGALRTALREDRPVGHVRPPPAPSRASCPTRIHVRDSKAEDGPALALSPAARAEFVAHAAR